MPMRLKHPFVASLADVRISRDCDAALIEYVEPGYSATRLTLGPSVQEMTDAEILDAHNACLEASERVRAEYDHVAIEIPLGTPQIRYHHESAQWVPRGDVVRCVMDDGEDGPTVHIDDEELSWEEFGGLLSTYAGWGMRIVFVPDDEIHLEPQIDVRQPRRDER